MLPILTSLALLAAPQAVAPVGTLQQLAIPDSAEGLISFPVQLEGEAANLILEPYSARAADFQLFATSPDGSVVEMPAPAAKTWRGYIEGREDSVVTASITPDGMSALVTDYGMKLEWQIQPAEGYAADVYSVALITEIDVPMGTCGVTATPQPTVPSPGGGGTTSNLGTGFQLVEIAIDADFDFFQRNGSSVQATMDDIERIMNRVDIIYQRDVDVQVQITALVVRSNANDPYNSTNAGNRLNEFRAEWQGNFSGVRRDLAHLFTGVNVDGGTIGVAFLGAVCSTNIGYGLSESRFTNNLAARTGLTAHEIGHNFNAGHCDGGGQCRIMCSGLGGCAGDVTQFGPASINTISNYAIGRPCLLDLALPLNVPVFDDVENGINRDIWISNQFVTASTAALNEPSGTQSLQFNASSANAEFDDVFISNQLLLAGLTDVEVSFNTQHSGVPAGGFLTLDAYTTDRRWVEIARITSDGVDQSTFNFTSVMIPPDGLWDQAQIRFSAGVNSLSENFFVDDVRIDDVSCGAITPYCVAGPNSVSAAGAQLQAFGTTSIAANDLVLLATSTPPNVFGIWLYAENQVQSPLGPGFLCVNGAQIFRYAVVQSDFIGDNLLFFDHNALPGGSVINVGDVQNFQLWYRDTTAAGFSLTGGLSVEFCP